MKYAALTTALATQARYEEGLLQALVALVVKYALLEALHRPEDNFREYARHLVFFAMVELAAFTATGRMRLGTVLFVAMWLNAAVSMPAFREVDTAFMATAAQYAVTSAVPLAQRRGSP